MNATSCIFKTRAKQQFLISFVFNTHKIAIEDLFHQCCDTVVKHVSYLTLNVGLMIYDECGRLLKVLSQCTCSRFEGNHEEVRIASFMPVVESRIF
jgi:hypothetical protein